jgi:hypothetical protein
MTTTYNVYGSLPGSGDNDLDIVPTNDEKEHIPGSGCPCQPKVMVKGANLIIIHNAYDFREVKEGMSTLMQDILND